MTSNIGRKVLASKEQELAVNEAHNEEKHENCQKHHHPGTLAFLREHAQLKNTTEEELVNKELSHKHPHNCGQGEHEDLQNHVAGVWGVPSNNYN